jgi:ABC-type multidrug transport system fused ATPase/permease subunit
VIFARVVGCAVVQVGVTIGSALLVRRIFDGWVAGGVAVDRDLGFLCLGLAALALLAGLTRVVERFDSERLGQDYVHQVRLLVFDQLAAMSSRVLLRRSRGAILMRFINDLSALRLWVSLGLARLWSASILAVGTLGVLAFLSVPLAVAVGAVIAGGAFLAFLLGRTMEGAIRETRRRRGRLASNVTDKIASMASVQVHGQTARERRRIAHQGQRLGEAMVHRARVIGALRGVAETSTSLAIAAALIVGAQQVAAGRVTAGVVVASLAIVSVLVPQVRTLGRVWEYWQAAQVSRQKLEGFLATPSDVRDASDATPLEDGPGRIVFADVSLSGSLTGVRLDAEPGQRIAVVGPNGAGKSTLLAVAARLADPDSGRVILDGRNLRKVTLESLRRAVGLVSSDAPLVRGSLARNLRYGAPEVSRRERSKVMRLCGVDRVAAALPEGLETQVTENGGNLSTGHRKRVMLARALLGKPRLLLLDEADTNLDPEARKDFDRALAAFPGTVLMVTHELERVRSADRVWHLEAGLLVEAGTPDELLERNGPTARLFRGKRRQRRRAREGSAAASSKARAPRKAKPSSDSKAAREARKSRAKGRSSTKTS